MKKSYFIIPVTVVLLLAVLTAGVFGCSGGSASKAGTVSTDSNSETSASDTELQDYYHVGESLVYNGLKIVYMSSGVENNYSEYFPPQDGYQFIYLQFSFENYSDKDCTVSFYNFTCYADGYEMEAHYNDENQLSASLSAGRNTTGYVEFEVPIDAQDVEIEYKFNAFSDKKVIFLYEGENNSGYVPQANTSASEEVYSVGDIIETDSLRISYLSCEDYVSDNQFIQPKDGYHYVTLTLEVENIGDSDEVISYYDFNCYADGASCEQLYSRDDILSATISAGRKAQGTITFEVPDNASVIEAECETNVWTDTKIIFKVK